MNGWFVVPAAGVGKRFGSDIPKQYLTLAGKRVVEHTLERLLSLTPRGIVIAVSREDSVWRTLPLSRHPLISVVTGGQERSDSVRNALVFLREKVDSSDWILVHDVARPCVSIEDISRLFLQLENSAIGGILATPVSDTLKLIGQDLKIEKTEDRSKFWAALTPQMFRFDVLMEGVDYCLQNGIVPTDEAMALELIGYHPELVEARRDNIKITRPEDMAIAETILCWQHQQGAGGQHGD